MNTLYLPPKQFAPPPLARREARITVIEDEAQEGLGCITPRNWQELSDIVRSHMDEDFPTPKAHHFPSQFAPPPRKLRREKPPDFDELYDATDDESEEVPLVCSDSVKKLVGRSKNRYPSIVIPSPSKWPTIQKLQESAITAVPVTALHNIPVRSEKLCLHAARTLQVPTSTSTPSLDGDVSSADGSSDSSCPTTPDMQCHSKDDQEWSIHKQLHPRALEALQHMSREYSSETREVVTEVPQLVAQEMVQIAESDPMQKVNIVVTPIDCPSEPISALSVPSPGGLFSSLRGSVRHTWASPRDFNPPSTSTAEEFYGVPWRRSLSTITEVNTADLDGNSILSRRISTNTRSSIPPEEFMVIKTTAVCEYDESYCDKLQEVGSANLEQTSDWLSAQATFIDDALGDDGPRVPKSEPSSSVRSSPTEQPSGSGISPSKKAVRFADEIRNNSAAAPGGAQQPQVSSSFMIYHGFQHFVRNTLLRDAVTQGEVRVEALKLQRLYIAHTHRNQLRGLYEVKIPQRPHPSRPVSQLLAQPDENNAFKELVARAEQESQALDQIEPSVWALAALKCLQKGRLLVSPVNETFTHDTSRMIRVLDLGGEPVSDWAWDLALSHRGRVKICTAAISLHPSASLIRGPSDHRVVPLPHLRTLPFPNASFDVISARTLYRFLRMCKSSPTTAQNGTADAGGLDEWDMCLRECMRCLKPSGHLEFWLMDSDIVRGGKLATALSVEFGFLLRTRGYDAQPTKSFIARLHKAGFKDVNRAWSFLPLGGAGPLRSQTTRSGIGVADGGAVMGSTRAAANVAGLLGSWMWEKWVLKLQTETGREEGRLLEGVAAALEEGREGGAGWRCLSGWARKPA